MAATSNPATSIPLPFSGLLLDRVTLKRNMNICDEQALLIATPAEWSTLIAAIQGREPSRTEVPAGGSGGLAP